ncbi:MAG: PAS domain S-box protein [Candidatus Latescibacterota bacterium]|nr:MAG: PAS domain S-box protein [Candidatus Latescibacterota bacterium]
MADESIGNDASISSPANRVQQVLAFVEIANAMLDATDLDRILSAITREVSRLVDFDVSSVAILTPDKQQLVHRNIHKGDDTAEKFGEGRLVPIDEKSVIGWVVIHRESVHRPNIQECDRFKEVLSEEPLKSDMVVPLISRGELIGTLNIGSYQLNAFTEADVEVIENCAKFASLAIDHTQLRLEAEELGNRYKNLVENANDIIMLVGKGTGKLVEVNRKCESVLGYSRDQLIGRSYFELFAEEEQNQVRRDLINVLTQRSMNIVDRKMLSRDGNLVFVDINANVITLQDGVYIQMIVHNVSQRRMLEHQIIVQNKNLQEINKKLTDVDQMKTEFLANISHELRTPLSIIIAYSESLKDPELPEESRKQFLEVISENGANLLTLINNLLDLSKLEVSGQLLKTSLSHIHDVINSVWPQMEKRAKTKNVDLSFVPDPNVPVTYLDNSQIVQVIACLIQNAIKFTDGGGAVSVETVFTGNEIWVMVIDSGMGIREEEIPHIFETFHQVDASSSRKWGGLGIGLALARHIVELHKGRIWVESQYGSGSTFTVALPLETEQAFLDNASTDGSGSQAEPAGGLGGSTIPKT